MGNTASKIVADKERISLKEKIGYGFGDMASSMFWKLFGSYLMIFYTDVFGLPAAVVGTMFLITRVWDSAFDPIVGVVADRTHSRWGKFRPYLLYLAVPFALIGILTFTTPALSDTGKLIYAYVTYSLMMMVYSAINVPYASLLGVMSPDPKERNTLSTYRMTFAYIGSFIALLLFMPMANLFAGSEADAVHEQRGWMLAVVVIAVMCAVLFYFCFALTRERVKPIKEKLEIFIDKYISLLLKNPFLPAFILKEIHRDPEFLASVIKSTGVKPNALFSMFEKEMNAGNIRRMDPKDLLINMLALSVFPVAAKPLMQIMFFENDKRAYNDFLVKRKESVKEFIFNSILTK